MKYDKNKSLTENAMAGVDITEPTLPTEVELPSETELPESFYDGIYEYLQDTYGRKAGKYPEAYGIEIKITDISWDNL